VVKILLIGKVVLVQKTIASGRVSNGEYGERQCLVEIIGLVKDVEHGAGMVAG